MNRQRLTTPGRLAQRPAVPARPPTSQPILPPVFYTQYRQTAIDRAEIAASRVAICVCKGEYQAAHAAVSAAQADALSRRRPKSAQDTAELSLAPKLQGMLERHDITTIAILRQRMPTLRELPQFGDGWYDQCVAALAQLDSRIARAKAARG